MVEMETYVVFGPGGC